MASEESPAFVPLTGSCVCGALTYTLSSPPMITHCCHCTYCQSETGSAFALNAAIECYFFTITSSTQPSYAHRPSPSSPDGTQHLVAHCPDPKCNTDVFAHYGGNKKTVYLKVGSLDETSRRRVRPDVHIFARSKVEWLDLSSEEKRGVKLCEAFYEREDVWSQESLERLEKLRAWINPQETVNGAA